MTDLNQSDVQVNTSWDGVSSPVEQQWWQNQQISSIEQALQWPETQQVVYTKASEITDFSIPSLETQPSATSTWTPSINHAAVMAAKKARLIQLLRNQLNKWKKVWFIRWILSWVALMLWVAIVLVVFAKDSVLSMLSDGSNTVNNQASIVSLNANDDIIDESVDEDIVGESVDEDVVDESVDDEIIDESVDDEIIDESIDDEIIDESIDDEIIDESVDDEIIDESVDDEIIDESIDDEIIDESIDDEIIDESVDEDVIFGDWYTIKHVNSVEEANWVLNPSCEWLSCDNKDLDSIVLCKEFKLKPDIDDNAQRIWSSWVCRYKDVSELAYLEIQ